jgi:hypothetical protein
MKQAPHNRDLDRDAIVACAEAFLRLAEPVVINIGEGCEPAYDLVLFDFNPFTRCHARSRSQQLIWFSLNASLLRRFAQLQ